MTMRCFADTDAPCLGDLYDGMDTMVEKVKLSIQAHETNRIECEALYKKVEDIIHHHWEDDYPITPPCICLIPKVASSSSVEWNWSTYSYIHLVNCNRLGSKKAEDLVYIHTNLHLLSRKEHGYNEGSTKLWDVTPKSANLDATLQDLTMMTDDDVDNIIARTSSTIGTMHGSNELASVAEGEDDEMWIFLRILMILND